MDSELQATKLARIVPVLMDANSPRETCQMIYDPLRWFEETSGYRVKPAEAAASLIEGIGRVVLAGQQDR